MQKIDEKLLDMAIRLEMGGTVFGEDAARTIREAIEVLDDVADGARLEIRGLEDEIDGLERALDAKERELDKAEDEIERLKEELGEYQRAA